MNHHVASSLARARHLEHLAESAERRRTAVVRAPRPHRLRRTLGAAIASFGRAFVALGEAIAWSA